MKKLFFTLMILALGLFVIPNINAAPTPRVVSSADGKAAIVISNMHLEHDITVTVHNPTFGEHTGFFKITVWASGHGVVHPHDLTDPHFNFYGRITVRINDSKMLANGGVMQGGGSVYKSGDSDGQWQTGWASVNSTGASVSLNNGNMVYGLPNMVYIGPSFPNDDRNKQGVGAYSNDGKGYIWYRGSSPDIGGRDDFEFIEWDNPYFFTCQTKRCGTMSITTIDENGPWIYFSGGGFFQGWLLDSALATSVSANEIYFNGYSWIADTPRCIGVSVVGSWSYTDPPYHKASTSSYALGAIHIGYQVPICVGG